MSQTLVSEISPMDNTLSESWERNFSLLLMVVSEAWLNDWIELHMYLCHAMTYAIVHREVIIMLKLKSELGFS